MIIKNVEKYIKGETDENRTVQFSLLLWQTQQNIPEKLLASIGTKIQKNLLSLMVRFFVFIWNYWSDYFIYYLSYKIFIYIHQISI